MVQFCKGSLKKGGPFAAGRGPWGRCNHVCGISSGSVHSFLLRWCMWFRVRMATFWHLLMILSSSAVGCEAFGARSGFRLEWRTAGEV